MAAYTKAIASLLGSIAVMASTVGLTIPDSITGLIPTISSLIGTALVYLLANRTA